MISFFNFQADAATYLDPALKWKTIETLHFKIHYYPEIESSAYKMASIAEEVHSRLSPLFKHTPDLKTGIVLLDTTDYSNGFATVFPNPLITIYLSDLGSNLKPYSYEDWLKFVFVHEYTHLLHLDTVESGPLLFKFLFGRGIFPNALNPKFIIEGLATYIETHYTKGGRGSDPRWRAMMRMDVLENNLKSIDQASVDTVKWPMGNVSYLYGVSFLEYLSKTYGEEKLYRLSQEYGDYFFSYGMDSVFVNIYGKGLLNLWRDWQENISSEAEREKENISKKPISTPVLLTNKGYYGLKPKWKDSSAIYFSQINPNDSAQIRKLDLKTGKEDKIINGIFFDDSLWTSQNNIYFSKGDIYNNFYFYKDIYSLDLITHGLKRLTSGERASDPALSPDGKMLAYVKNHVGRRTLWLMDSNGENKRKIGYDIPHIQYFSPQFSPDGKKLAAARWLNGKQKIYLIDLRSGKEEPLINYNLSLEANPCFSPDGRYILFDSDASGIVNLYAFDLKTNKIRQVTNVLGMAMMPDISPDGKKIVYVNYSSRGYDLALLDFDPQTWEDVENLVEEPKSLEPANSYDKSEVILKRYNYNPLSDIAPKFWFPYSYRDENGEHLLAYTAGIDSLAQHYFLLQGGFDWKAKRQTYNFAYFNNQFLPQIALGLSDAALPYSWDSGSKTYWERNRKILLNFSLYDNRVFSEFDRQSVLLGYEYINLSNITSLEILTAKPNIGNLSGAVFGYNYRNTRTYGYSISPEEGLDASFYFRTFSKELGSNYNLTSYTVSGRQYLKTFFPHNVLALKASGDLIRGDSLVQSGFSYNYLSLRGYPSKAISGSKSIVSALEYLFPIAYIESGFGYGYTFFDRLWGNVFFEGGGATAGKASDILWKRSYGAELNLKTINGWGMYPIVIVLGYAKGLDAQGEEQIYFSFGL